MMNFHALSLHLHPDWTLILSTALPASLLAVALAVCVLSFTLRHGHRKHRAELARIFEQLDLLRFDAQQAAAPVRHREAGVGSALRRSCRCKLRCGLDGGRHRTRAAARRRRRRLLRRGAARCARQQCGGNRASLRHRQRRGARAGRAAAGAHAAHLPLGPNRCRPGTGCARSGSDSPAPRRSTAVRYRHQRAPRCAPQSTPRR